MKIKVKGRTVDFFEHDVSTKNKIAVSTSSGTDSTLVLYLTALCLPDKKIIPYHLEESQYPGQKPNLLKIIDYLNSILPTKNITQPITNYCDYSTKGSKWKLQAIENPGELPKKPDGNTGQAKILASRYYEDREWKKGTIDYLVLGSNSNPPIEALKNLTEPYEERRNTNNRPEPLVGDSHYLPFFHLDKSYIAEMWKKYILMEAFPLTISCIEYSPNIIKPCKKCYWCYEKFWAFGMYDGGIK